MSAPARARVCVCVYVCVWRWQFYFDNGSTCVSTERFPVASANADEESCYWQRSKRQIKRQKTNPKTKDESNYPSLHRTTITTTITTAWKWILLLVRHSLLPPFSLLLFLLPWVFQRCLIEDSIVIIFDDNEPPHWNVCRFLGNIQANQHGGCRKDDIVCLHSLFRSVDIDVTVGCSIIFPNRQFSDDDDEQTRSILGSKRCALAAVSNRFERFDQINEVYYIQIEQVLEDFTLVEANSTFEVRLPWSALMVEFDISIKRTITQQSSSIHVATIS